eukprot:COSAG05_NODE_312_length_11626_cov_9.515485_9_plen_33_part_00
MDSVDKLNRLVMLAKRYEMLELMQTLDSRKEQ